MLNDLDGAAEAYREALEGAPDDPIVAVGAGVDRGAPRGLVDAAGGADAAPGRDVRAPIRSRCCSSWRATPSRSCRDADQAIGFLRQIIDVDAAQRRSRTWSWSGCCARTRAGTTWSTCWASTPTPKATAGRKPAELALRVAIADVWEKELDSPDSAAEALEKVLEVAPDERRRRCCRWRACTRAAERWDEAGEALERRPRTRRRRREIAEIQFRNAQILTRARRRDPAEIERALLRALDADPTHRPTLEALEKMARDAQGRRAAGAAPGAGGWRRPTRRRASASACCARSRRCTRTARPRRRRRCRTSSGWWRSDPKEIARARAAGRRADRRGPHRRRRPHHGAS